MTSSQAALDALRPHLPPPEQVFQAWQRGFESARLLFKPIGPSNEADWQALHLDKAVTQYVYGPDMTVADCWRDLAFAIGHAQLRGFSMWAVYTLAEEQFIGRVGPWMPEGWPGLEVGWAIGSEFQGKGYGSEAAEAALDWTAQNIPGAACAIHSLHPENAQSLALAKRIGAQFLGDADISGDPHQIWVSDLSRRRSA